MSASSPVSSRGRKKVTFASQSGTSITFSPYSHKNLKKPSTSQKAKVNFNGKNEILDIINTGGEITKYFLDTKTSPTCPILNSKIKTVLGSGVQGTAYLIDTPGYGQKEYVAKIVSNTLLRAIPRAHKIRSPETISKIAKRAEIEKGIPKNLFISLNGDDGTKEIKYNDTYMDLMPHKEYIFDQHINHEKPFAINNLANYYFEIYSIPRELTIAANSDNSSGIIKTGDTYRVLTEKDLKGYTAKDGWLCRTPEDEYIQEFFFDPHGDKRRVDSYYLYPRGSYLCDDGTYPEYIIGLICSNLYESGTSINFLNMFGFGICDYTSVYNDVYKKYENRKRGEHHSDKGIDFFENPGSLDPVKIGDYTFMERIHGDVNGLFSKLTSSKTTSKLLLAETADSIFVQVMFGISCMQRVHGIQHNDLHLGNVFYEDVNIAAKEGKYTTFKGKKINGKTRLIHYIIDGKNIFAPFTGVVAKIGDFGFSVKHFTPIVSAKDKTIKGTYNNDVPQWRDDSYDMLYSVASLWYVLGRYSLLVCKAMACIIAGYEDPSRLFKSFNSGSVTELYNELDPSRASNKSARLLWIKYYQSSLVTLRPNFVKHHLRPWDLITDPRIMGGYLTMDEAISIAPTFGELYGFANQYFISNTFTKTSIAKVPRSKNDYIHIDEFTVVKNPYFIFLDREKDGCSPLFGYNDYLYSEKNRLGSFFNSKSRQFYIRTIIRYFMQYHNHNNEFGSMVFRAISVFDRFMFSQISVVKGESEYYIPYLNDVGDMDNVIIAVLWLTIQSFELFDSLDIDTISIRLTDATANKRAEEFIEYIKNATGYELGCVTPWDYANVSPDYIRNAEFMKFMNFMIATFPQLYAYLPSTVFVSICLLVRIHPDKKRGLLDVIYSSNIKKKQNLRMEYTKIFDMLYEHYFYDKQESDEIINTKLKQLDKLNNENMELLSADVESGLQDD